MALHIRNCGSTTILWVCHLFWLDGKTVRTSKQAYCGRVIMIRVRATSRYCFSKVSRSEVDVTLLTVDSETIIKLMLEGRCAIVFKTFLLELKKGLKTDCRSWSCEMSKTRKLLERMLYSRYALKPAKYQKSITRSIFPDPLCCAARYFCKIKSERTETILFLQLKGNLPRN